MRRECSTCGQLLRNQRQRASDHPGTRDSRNGVCTTCLARERAVTRADELEAEVVREQAIEAERDTRPIGPHMEPGDALDLDWLTDPALKALISDRRTRGIPAAGLSATGEPTTPKPRTNPLGHALTQWIERKQP